MASLRSDTPWLHIPSIVLLVVAIGLMIGTLTDTCPRADVTCTAPLQARELSDACGPVNNTCVVGALLTEFDACEIAYAPANISCDNVCYTPGANTTECDGRGQCIGDYSECLGHCVDVNDCTSRLPIAEGFNNLYFDAALTQITSDVTDVPLIESAYITCLFNECQLYILTPAIDALDTDLSNGNTWPITMGFQCRSFLEVGFLETYGGCIIESSDLLDTNLTLHLDPAEESAPLQYRMCKLTYACSAFNQTLIAISEASLNNATNVTTVPVPSGVSGAAATAPSPAVTVGGFQKRALYEQIIGKAAAARREKKRTLKGV